MGSPRSATVLSQDKAWLRLPRNPLTRRPSLSSTCIRACSGFLRRRWPLAVALISVGSVATGPGLGLGLNLSGSAPRGLYRAVEGAPARGALVTACLPLELALFGRLRGYLGAGDCPGGTQPMIKTLGAVAGDRVELGREVVTVNAVPRLRRSVRAFDSSARPLSHVAFGSYPVADDQVWLFGLSDARSWDSRYFGPVPLTAVRNVVRPVIAVDGGIRQ
jgi:conjugative transfer signal peptidase TraF